MPSADSAPIIQTTLIPRADGSASYNYKGTTVLTSVNGPMEVRPRDELPSKAFVEILVRPSSGVSGTREKLLESQLHSVLHPLIHLTYHPRTVIQLNVQIVEEAGDVSDLLAACINSCVLALCDTGTPMVDVVVAASVGDRKEGRHTFAFAGRGERCVFADSVGGENGGFKPEEWGRRMSEARVLCQGEGMVAAAVRRALVGKVEEGLWWRNMNREEGGDRMEEDA